MSASISERRANASYTLEEHAHLSGNDNASNLEKLTDLLADLRHLCAHEGADDPDFDFDSAVRHSVLHFEAEIEEER